MRRRLTICALALALAAQGATAAPRRPPARSQPPEIVWTARHGFEWLDAGIGAAAALGTVLIVQAVVSPTIRRRKR